MYIKRPIVFSGKRCPIKGNMYKYWSTSGESRTSVMGLVQRGSERLGSELGGMGV